PKNWLRAKGKKRLPAKKKTPRHKPFHPRTNFKRALLGAPFLLEPPHAASVSLASGGGLTLDIFQKAFTRRRSPKRRAHDGAEDLKFQSSLQEGSMFFSMLLSHVVHRGSLT